MKTKATRIILLFLPVMITLQACDKALLDPRRKWVGDWEFTVEGYDFSSQENFSYTESGKVEYARDPNDEFDMALLVDGYLFGVDQKGNLTQPSVDARGSGGETVGTISKKTLDCEFNSSGGTNPGALIHLTGTKKE